MKKMTCHKSTRSKDTISTQLKAWVNFLSELPIRKQLLTTKIFKSKIKPMNNNKLT